MRLPEHWDYQARYRLILTALGLAAILAILFLANWMDTRCWGADEACTEQDSSQR